MPRLISRNEGWPSIVKKEDREITRERGHGLHKGPDLIEVTNERVQLNQSPHNLIQQAILVLKKIPERVTVDSITSALHMK